MAKLDPLELDERDARNRTVELLQAVASAELTVPRAWLDRMATALDRLAPEPVTEDPVQGLLKKFRDGYEINMRFARESGDPVAKAKREGMASSWAHAYAQLEYAIRMQQEALRDD